jgi:hypothetical protein
MRCAKFWEVSSEPEKQVFSLPIQTVSHYVRPPCVQCSHVMNLNVAVLEPLLYSAKGNERLIPSGWSFFRFLQTAGITALIPQGLTEPPSSMLPSHHKERSNLSSCSSAVSSTLTKIKLRYLDMGCQRMIPPHVHRSVIKTVTQDDSSTVDADSSLLHRLGAASVV